jgi:hypothetical protein
MGHSERGPLSSYYDHHAIETSLLVPPSELMPDGRKAFAGFFLMTSARLIRFVEICTLQPTSDLYFFSPSVRVT